MADVEGGPPLVTRRGAGPSGFFLAQVEGFMDFPRDLNKVHVIANDTQSMPLSHFRRNLPFLLLLATPQLVHAASTITPIPVLAGKVLSSAAGVSGDGQTVVGTATDINGVNGEAYRWTASEGAMGLGFLPGGSTSVGRAISKDGSTIVGDATSSYAQVIGGTEAFRYAGGAMMALHSSQLLIMSQAFAVSGDGSVVVDSNGNRRWTLAGGVEQNVVPYGCYGISSDGTVVVGQSNGFKAQRWTAGSGVTFLPVPDGTLFSEALAVSSDGLVAVGSANHVACYWSQAEGFVRIGPTGVISTALAVNRDGSVMVGRGNILAGGGTTAFVWTRAGGMQDLVALLKAQGVDLSAFLYKRFPSLVECTGISDDGKVVVGNGTRTGFVLQLELTPSLSPLDQWRQDHFGSSANTGDGAEAADPDQDGRPNFVEYALNGDPKSAGSVPSASVSIVGDHAVLGFNRVADPSLTYSVEATTSLALPAWNTIWSSTGASNVAGHVDVADTAQASSQSARFLRLKVSH